MSQVHSRAGGARLLFALTTAALLLLPGCRTHRAGPGDVLLITVDALRPDHLGLYGYDRPTSPNLDRWLADAAIFERAYSAAAQTAPAVPSLLSGRLPQEHGVRLIWQLLPAEVALLPDLLPDEYQSAAFVSNMVLTDEASGMASRFDHYDDFVDERESERLFFERSAARTVDAALRWLEEDRDPARPLFLWVHLIDPHGPYDPPPDWPRSFDHDAPRPIAPEQVKPYMRLPDVDDALVYVDRYDEEIAYADHHLGRLLRAYADAAPIDRALVILTSDHGESMLEHDEWFRHGHHVYEEVVRVPLAVRAPGVEPGVRAGPASILDVAPTVLRFAGAPVPDGLRGIDLRAGAGPDPDRAVFFEAHSRDHLWRAELRGDLKWVARQRRGAREIEQRLLYDLATDPDELNPLSWTAREEGPRELLALCRDDPDPGGLPEAYARGERIDAPKVADRADERALESLRALGYVD